MENFTGWALGNRLSTEEINADAEFAALSPATRQAILDRVGKAPPPEPTPADDPVKRWIDYARRNELSWTQLELEPNLADLTEDQQANVRDAVDSPNEADDRWDGVPEWLRRVLSKSGQPLAQTHMSYLWWTAPTLAFTDEGGFVRLTTSAAAFVPPQKDVPQVGRWFLGAQFRVDGDSLVGDYATFRNVQPPVQAGARDNVHVTYELDDDAVTQIDEGEDEQCADFQRVLDVSYKALEDAATEISMQWFTGKEAALGALVSLLSASGPNPLVPAEPLKLSNWTRRLKEVANLLESQSRRKRDVEHRDHSSSGYRMTEEARDGSNVHVVLIPTFANPHRTPEEVVSLADI